MSERRTLGPILKRVAIEAALWYGLAAAFLAAYVGYIRAPAAPIAPHLHIVTDYVLAFAFARLALAAAGLPPRLLRFASSLLLFAAVSALVLFYGLALVGLRSWGRVTTWELVASYAPQAWPLLEAAGFSVPVVETLLALACAGLLWAAWLYVGRLDWVPLVAARISRLPLALAATCLLVTVVVDLQRFMIIPPVREEEPISLSFYPAAATAGMESNGIDNAVAARRDAAEDAARASYRPSAQAIRRNVILIVSDALRADHMHVYGYARDTTPNLDRLAAAGLVRVAPPVHTACSESLCGLLALASSRYVHQFSRRMFVLQRVFALHGYRTVMILGGDHTHFYGLREQYGQVDTYFDASAAKSSYINDDRLVLDRVAALGRWDGTPVMMQLHLMSSHLLGKRHEAGSAYLPAANYFFPANRTEDGKVSQKVINFYDDGVREADAMIGRLLDSLASKGYLSDAVVAITGDHGEGLGEHGYWAHQNSVYDEELRVPFLMISYGYRPERPIDRHRLPSQVDIAPTLLEELRMPRPANWVGEPLQGDRRDDFAYFEQKSFVGLLDRRDPRNAWKYWEDRARGTAYAFNLSRDPGELHNRISEVPRARVREWQLQLLPLHAQYAANPWR